MASQKDIESIYDVFSSYLRMNMGDNFDFTCAFYDGNYNQTLEQAQEAKHQYILDGVKFKKGMRVLDIGCGWGPLLKAITERGGQAVGLTLSSDQVAVCRKYGLEAHLKDYKELTPRDFGKFDAVASVGAFEHFCSPQEHMEGKQDAIYQDFFRRCANVLPKGGRVYVQTSVWTDKVPPYPAISLKAYKKDSTEYLLALLEKYFPGSWIPHGKEQVAANAKGFKLVSMNTSDTDYLHTIQEWAKRGRGISLKKLWEIIKFVPRYLTDRDFRYQLECLSRGVFTTMYKRKVMYLVRAVFEKQ